jgi:hypothetical protein
MFYPGDHWTPFLLAVFSVEKRDIFTVSFEQFTRIERNYGGYMRDCPAAALNKTPKSDSNACFEVMDGSDEYE